MDIYFSVASILCLILVAFITGSFVNTLGPSGSQNASLIRLVSFTSVAFGVVGWLLAVWGFGGNVNYQTLFLVIFTLALFSATIISSTVTTSQLNDIRNTIANLVPINSGSSPLIGIVIGSLCFLCVGLLLTLWLFRRNSDVQTKFVLAFIT